MRHPHQNDCRYCQYATVHSVGERIDCACLHVRRDSTSWEVATGSDSCSHWTPTTAKDTNPKDALGAAKLPLHLVPATAVALASVAHLNGALKYGASNWRVAGVRASIYLDALRRHISSWENGEELDPDDGVPHLAAAMACLNIIVDSRAAGKLTDDRPPSVDLGGFMAGLTPLVKQLQTKHAGRRPRHYTIADSEVKP